MRRGEVLALQWQDYLPERKLLIVRRALSQVTDTHIVVKGTKTDTVRSIPITDSLVQELDTYKQRTPYSKSGDWICIRADGSHLIPRLYTRFCDNLMKRIGIDISLHGLRHTHATALLLAGIPTKVVSERLGHSSIEITLNLYAHVLPTTMQHEVVDIVETIWQRQNP